jgi:hypothetical protein
MCSIRSEEDLDYEMSESNDMKDWARHSPRNQSIS